MEKQDQGKNMPISQKGVGKFGKMPRKEGRWGTAEEENPFT
jgi:hypothetical protein